MEVAAQDAVHKGHLLFRVRLRQIVLEDAGGRKLLFSSWRRWLVSAPLPGIVAVNGNGSRIVRLRSAFCTEKSPAHFPRIVAELGGTERQADALGIRSEERRVGKESRCRGDRPYWAQNLACASRQAGVKAHVVSPFR